MHSELTRDAGHFIVRRVVAADVDALVVLRAEHADFEITVRAQRWGSVRLPEMQMSVSLRQVWVFFYGTIMNPAVMKDFGVIAGKVSPARLADFVLTIRPRPNLVRSERSTVFGSLMTVTHEDLTTIYSGLEKHFGIKYLPEAVFATTFDGELRPALCYTVPDMPDAPADPEFVKQLAQCVRAMGHPEWYASYVESLSTVASTGPVMP